MHIEIHSSELKRLVKLTAPAVNGRQPAFANVELARRGDAVTMRARSDKGVTVTASARLNDADFAEEDDSSVLDGEALKRVTAVTGGDAKIHADGAAVSIRSRHGRTTLQAIPWEMPDTPAVSGQRVTVSSAELAGAIDGVLYAAATDPTRVILTGVLMQAADGAGSLVALDGFQMSVERFRAEGERMEIVIPADTLKTLRAGLTDTGTVTVDTDGKSVRLETEGLEVTSPLLTGTYLDYNRVLPKESKTRALIDTAAFRTLMDGAGSATGGSSDRRQDLVKLTFGPEGLTAQKNSSTADYEGSIPCEVSGDGLTIAFSRTYVTNMLNAAKSGTVEVSMNTPTSPMTMTDPEHRESWLRLALPVRVQ